MKAVYLLLVFSCIFSVRSFAQQKGAVEVGAQFGIGRSGIDLISSSGPAGSLTIANYSAGISTDLYWSDSWSFKIKVLYDQKGFDQKDIIIYPVLFNINMAPSPSPAQNVYSAIHLNYITIPLTANYHFGYKHRLNFDIGPYLGVLLKATDADEPAGYQNIKSEYNNVDAGLTVGFGYKYPIAKRLKLFLEYQMQNGITNAVNTTQNPGVSYRNVCGSLTIGISF